MVGRDRRDAVGLGGRAIENIGKPGLDQTVQNVGSQIGSLLADFQESVRRHSTTVEPMTDASEAMDLGNEDHAIDKRGRKSTTDPLSPREIATIDLIGRGQSNKAIARTLGIAPETAKIARQAHLFEAGGRIAR